MDESDNNHDNHETHDEDKPKKQETRRIFIPSHRFTPLKNSWIQIYEPLVRHMKLQVRMNSKSRLVEIRESPEVEDPNALNKGEDFIKAFASGFPVEQALALLRLDDIYVDSFTIKEVRQTLKGANKSRAVGRIAGKDGKTKYAIENATRTRIVLEGERINIMGTTANVNNAKRVIVDLIRGSPAGKINTKLRAISSLSKGRL
eukprot:TRINITY_DN2646_c0_g1_i1.p1 TRINITY_DN2646_c0_g1~~TRINITY_DN2646_c0_g1_i1.p1  ORF type:complete len:215 (+),score=59.03 TRINITY_DN2646_c0_g1_i1:38-646(+)